MLRNTILTAGSLLLGICPAFAEDMTLEEIKNGYKRHAALTQFHRWFLLYEKPAYGIDNQLDILSGDIEVKSGLGEAKGHAAYTKRVEQLPETWKNAHDVRSTKVTVKPDGTIALEAEVTYLNEGLLPDGGIRTSDLTYMTELVPTDTALPLFQSISIAQNSEGTADNFTPAYAKNRVLSLVHYWLTLIEDPSRNPQPVEEILADSFSLNFSSGAITTFDGFKAWLAGPGSMVTASTHKIGDFTIKETGENTYEASMTFDWNGLLPDGKEMTAKTAHTWQIVDDPTERFARIKTVDVEVLEPFTPKAAE